MNKKHKVIKRCLIGCGIAVLITGVIAVYGVYQAEQIFSMQNQVSQQIKSPDRQSVATLAYRDGLTFGFYYVSLQSTKGWRPLQPNDPIPHEEVAEVAAEGLEAIAWKGNHTLAVSYAKSSDNIQTKFVLKKTVWHDVHIVYCEHNSS